MQVAKRVGRYFQEARVANARAVITFAMILASAAFAAGCAGGAPKQANPDAVGSDGAPTASERTAEETAAPELGTARRHERETPWWCELASTA